MLVLAAAERPCQQRPPNAVADSSPSEDRFKFKMEQAENYTYMPEQQYIVELTSTKPLSYFVAFMITAETFMSPEDRRLGRSSLKESGKMHPKDNYTKYSERCSNSVEQSSMTPKNTTSVYWRSPPKGNDCVTLRAMVSENEEVWYNDENLTITVCEDTSNPMDRAPLPNENCQACSEARYELTFTGKWSRNSHPQNYPYDDWVPRYGDLIGASHSKNFHMWARYSDAIPELKELAETGSTNSFEQLIKANLAKGVRTLIKGKGHGYPNMDTPTYAMFRVDKTNHRITVMSGIIPSPDWFLGITDFELCQKDNSWLSQIELKLYPWDAGTDSGISYESINEPTMPSGKVDSVRVGSLDKASPFCGMNFNEVKPFATLRIGLIRTYEVECDKTADSEEQVENQRLQAQPEPPPNYSILNEPLISYPEQTNAPEATAEQEGDKCPLTSWSEWSECQGSCGKGFQTRSRYHEVNGVPYKYYRHEHERSQKPPQECEEQELILFEMQDCYKEC